MLGRKVVAKTRPDGTVAEPVAAFDMTFSPSKSVSLLWALSDSAAVRDAVVEAHEAAVAAGLGYLDQTAGYTRGGDGGVRSTCGHHAGTTIPNRSYGPRPSPKSLPRSSAGATLTALTESATDH